MLLTTAVLVVLINDTVIGDGPSCILYLPAKSKFVQLRTTHGLINYIHYFDANIHP